MPKKKFVPKKTSKKKRAPAKKSAKVAARPKAAARKAKPAAARAVAPAPKPVRAKVQTKKKKTRLVTRDKVIPTGAIAFPRRGLGSDAAGQSGDTEGLSEVATADSESVEELEEEGQAFEAEAVSGVENALDPDEGEVTTHEVPEDDVPREYDDEEQ
jgi:hypothetical protein